MRIADLFCCAGGASMGLHQAFPDAEIHGYDIRPQPRYPFTFHQQDALTVDLSGFDFVWASPPCQEHTSMKSISALNRRGPLPDWHKDALDATRDKLMAWGGPWIIENVVGAPLAYSAELCGLTFGLRVYRHRRFEAPFMLMAPPHLKHRIGTGSGRGQTQRKAAYMAGGFVTITGNVGSYCGPAMEIDWMTGAELSQSIPPAYSRYLAQFIPTALELAA
jgi:DNA (cytosine-5)-methyltransferase 1